MLILKYHQHNIAITRKGRAIYSLLKISNMSRQETKNILTSVQCVQSIKMKVYDRNYHHYIILFTTQPPIYLESATYPTIDKQWQQSLLITSIYHTYKKIGQSSCNERVDVQQFARSLYTQTTYNCQLTPVT